MFEAIILSDIHLGSTACQADLLQKFLVSLKTEKITKKLIINGDLFESFDSRLTKNHWKVLSLLRSLSDELELIWICGNHDESGPADSVAHMIGAKFFPLYYILEVNAVSTLLTHGHLFDRFLTDHPFITWISDLIYCFLQRIDPSCHFAKIAKKRSKTYLRCTEIIAEKAAILASQLGCSQVCCGHTHDAFSKDLCHNSGCWTELPCSYLGVEPLGDIKLFEMSA